MKKINKELKSLLTSDYLKDVEKKITKRIDSVIDYGNIPVYTRIFAQEIDISNLSIKQVSNVIKNQSTKLIEFATIFLELNDESDGQYHEDNEVIEDHGYAAGFSITHAIYLYYLDNYSDGALFDYLTRRGIPDARQTVTTLKQAYQKIQNEN